jgi:hypothetical protein
MYLLQAIQKLKKADQKLFSDFHVLDIGCNLGVQWWEWYKQLGFKTILGIDKDSQEDLLLDRYGEDPISYETFRHSNPQSNLTENEYSNIFKFHKLKISDFFNSDLFLNSKYDLIILSSFLYLFDKSEAVEILNKIKTIINTNGYLYIFTASENWQESSLRPSEALEGEEIKFKLNEKELNLMVSPFQVIVSSHYDKYRDVLCKKE